MSFPLKTNIQPRNPITLNNIEPALQIINLGQPLSPTTMTHHHPTEKQHTGKQTTLQGPPQHVGLSTLEYYFDDKLQVEAKEVDLKSIQQNYSKFLLIMIHIVQQLFDENDDISHVLKHPFVKIQERFCKLEILIKLPFQTLIEQVEFSIANIELYQKHLKLLKIQKQIDEHQEQDLLLKSGFQDASQKICELNTCGVGNSLKLCFLFDKAGLHQDYSMVKDLPEATQIQSNQFNKTQAVSDKIRNEIIPLLNVSDDDLDELDDEVAMISNKRTYPHKIQGNQNNNNDEISHEDIQIQIPSQAKEKRGKQSQQIIENQGRSIKLGSTSNNKTLKNEDDPENTRNFNSLPRNYSDSQNQQQNQLIHQEDTPSTKGIMTTPLQQQNIINIEKQIFQDLQVWPQILLQKTISSIKIIGFNMNTIPAITNMTVFMNDSFLLKKEKNVCDAFEVDFLTGILLISTKRLTQASEIFRKIQMHYLKKIEQNLTQQAKLNLESSPKNQNMREKNQKSQQILTQLKLETNKLFIKSAILELLVTESMNSQTQINDKLQSMKRMVDLFTGKQVPALPFQAQIFLHDDPYTTMIKILPHLLKFTIMCMTHKKEIVRMSALKLLEFILETQGCSLDQTMVVILKAILNTYPGIPSKNQQHSISGLQNSDSFCLSMISSSQSDLNNSPKLHHHQRNPIEGKSLVNHVGFKLKPQEPKPNMTQTLEKCVQGHLNEPNQVKEPASGFIMAMKNVYNHVLDTYISVLSSISSHILHQLFYEVIIPQITTMPTQSQSQDPQALLVLNEIKVFAIKIGEKIITICQGDLILNKQSLDQLLTTIVSKQNDQQTAAMKNLYQSIRTKVFTNYSLKGIKSLVDWLVEKMSLLAQNGLPPEASNKSSGGGSDIGKLEINEEETNQLSQLFDIVSLISVGRKKNEEEANNFIKIKQDFCIDLYLLINPLLFWLDFSVEREERLSLFKQVYQTIKDVLDNLPPRKVDLDVLQIMIPILQRITEYLKNNSPSLSMLKFLDIVLRDIKAGNYCARNTDLQYFFLEMLNNFVGYISYCLYEDIFPVFDKLLNLCQDVLNDKVLQKCVSSLVDKYTMKTKVHKNSIGIFMKSLLEVKIKNKQKQKAIKQQHSNNNLEMDELDMEEEDNEMSVHSKNNYFEIMCDFCFLSNEDPFNKVSSLSSTEMIRNLRNPTDCHDLYIDKLQFFIDSLGTLNEIHVNLFTALITQKKFKTCILNLLNQGETTLRLKCHEILEIVTNYYVQYCTSKTVYELAVPSSSNDLVSKRKVQNEVMEVEFINHERLYVSQMVVRCIRVSLEQKNDSYLQFNSLILLDFLFQSLLPVPTYQNDQLKAKGLGNGKNNQASQHQNSHSNNNVLDSTLDIEIIEINESTPEYEVTDQNYINLRLNLVFKLWPYILNALNSAWSNIRSICYGLICSMLKVDIRDYQTNQEKLTGLKGGQPQSLYLQKLKQIVEPMLQSLLSSKESESKAGGLNILGSFCGLSYDFSKVKISKNLDFFKKNSNFIGLDIWQLVFELQDDWDITIKEASVVLIQLCAPRDAVKYFNRIKKKKEEQRFTNMISKYGGQSSRSSRNQFQASAASIDEEFHQIESSKKNVLSFLSGTEDLSMMFHLDQNQFSQGIMGDIFEQTHSHPSKQISLKPKKIDDISLQENKKQNINMMENDLDVLAEYDDRELDQVEAFHFFVDQYTDDQIQEIISIFRNDFKPPKNLWIEKNPSASINCPDYYAEIYAQAIEQFNQQQMQLQQQQHQQMQLQVSSSPKAVSGVGGKQDLSFIDALEDDLVKKCENEKLEKQKKQSQNDGNYMIFERHFEDSKDQSSSETSKTQSLVSEESGNIDAEPYKFLNSDSPIHEDEKQDKKASQLLNNNSKSEEQKQISNVQPKIIEEAQSNSIDNNQKEEQTFLTNVQDQIIPINPVEEKNHDELIEEYERKINKTIQLLKEEEKKNLPKQIIGEDKNSKLTIESNAKSTPEFKTKKEIERNNEEFIIGKEGKASKKQVQNYLTEMTRGYLTNIDNLKLIKQINNCFNDKSLHIGQTPVGSYQLATVKPKQKLNKSFENLMAANKQSLKVSQNEPLKQSKKNMSSSPKRTSSSGKKQSKSAGIHNKKKYIIDSSQSKSNGKAITNLRDLNYFIKTIEKDLSDKFNKLNKDFNSVPTTPTSILKKVEDQVKALNLVKEQKNMMSNTCPTIAQVLSQIDTAQTSKSNQQLPPALGNTHNVKPLNYIALTSNHTPSNISQNGNIITAAQLNNFTTPQAFERFSFSKTQRLDLKDSSQSIFGQQQTILSGREGKTEREQQNEQYKKNIKVSPKIEEKTLYANLLKSKKEKSIGAKNSKRSRGSQEKFGIAMIQNQTHQTRANISSKLNKSANIIQVPGSTKANKKDSLSKSFIGETKNFLTNISPNSTNHKHNMLISQLQPSQITTLHHTPMQGQAFSSNIMYDHIYNTEQQKRIGIQKTPIKTSYKPAVGMTYTEILDMSPNSGEKDQRSIKYRQLY